MFNSKRIVQSGWYISPRWMKCANTSRYHALQKMLQAPVFLLTLLSWRYRGLTLT